ncbi:hypothetical protein ACFLXL_02935 [Chloroflexota bacterium]
MRKSKWYLFLPLGLALLLASSATGCAPHGLRLFQSDDEANTHFTNAMEYKNQFTKWMNNLSNKADPIADEWKSSLAILEQAIYEAKEVSPDFMGRAHPDLPDMWQGFFIPSMEKMHSYYSSAIKDPSSVKLPSTNEGMQQLKLLQEAHMLDNIFGDWFDQNMDAIRSGIRKMAR